jgi:ABC-type Fe3+ transport system substrate-binding protein
LTTTQTNEELGRLAAEWARSSEGQKAIAEGQEVARATVAQINQSLQPMSWKDWTTPFI